MDFVELTSNPSRACGPKALLTALVSQTSPTGVGVDVIDFPGVDLGVFHGHGHAAGGPLASGQRRAHVVGVGGQTVAGQLAVDSGAAFFGVLVFLEDDHAGALAHDKAVPAPVERTRSALRFVVARAQGAHGAETRDADRHDAGLAAAGEHDIGIAELDDAPGLAHAVVGRGAGRDDGHVRSAQAVLHRNETAGHVADHHGNHER
jgi:hypothetical protein